MKAICIKNFNHTNLKIGKIYDVKPVFGDHLPWHENYLLLVECNDYTWYDSRLFQPLYEWRQEQLNKLIK